MATSRIPEPGEWYFISGRLMVMVTAVDQDEQLIEIQHFDGTLAEIDVESWSRQAVEPIDEPEDWSGPFDDLEEDDLGYDGISLTATAWNNPIDQLD